MYQRDNRQKEVRKREKENDRGRGGDRGRERPLGSHRGRPEASDSPVSHIHNVIS